jgi:hypothetical protein
MVPSPIGGRPELVVADIDAFAQELTR